MHCLVPRTALVLLASLASCLSFARADYHYASHSGSNQYPYTGWQTATDSIKYAISAADPGDTVYIGPGEYFEIVYAGAADSNLAIIGAGVDSTHWWWNVWGTYTFICANNYLVRDIHFSHTITGCIGSGWDNNVTIEHCMFTDAGFIDDFGRGRFTIEDCVFDSVTGGVSVSGSVYAQIRNNLVDWTSESAFALIVADTAIIENNIVIDCFSESVWPYATNDSTLVQNNLAYNRVRRLGDCYDCPIVINCTFDNFRLDQTYYGAISVFRNSGTNYRNNSFSRLREAFDLNNQRPWTVSTGYSNLWDVGQLGTSYYHQPISWDTIGIQWRNPMYVGNEDYHLQAFSPLIDAGDPNILDVDGSRSDIGCYGGPAGSSYVYQDLPPRAPDSLMGYCVSDTVFLNWRMNTEADFFRYRIYRDSLSGFEPSAFNLIGAADSSFFIDTWLGGSGACYYRISAADYQGNVSGYSAELEVERVGVAEGGGAELPAITSIETNYPNPFNSRTTVIYTVANLGPIPARIRIDIFDILGRRIKTLVDEKREVGIHRAVWDGRDDGGNELPSGVYFARISQWGVALGGRPKKLVLMK